MVEIRRAALGDLERLIDLHAQFCSLDAHPFDALRARRAFEPLLDDDRHGVVWIVDTPASYAVLTWGWSIEAGGAEAVLDEIYVSERGAGVGSSLIEHVVADAARRGLARIFIETEMHNERARGFYVRHGFDPDDSVWLSRTFVDLS